MRQTFKPEFLNRIDDVVVFHALGFEDIEKIVDIQLADVRERLARERIVLEMTPSAIQTLSLDGLASGVRSTSSEASYSAPGG